MLQRGPIERENTSLPQHDTPIFSNDGALSSSSGNRVTLPAQTPPTTRGAPPTNSNSTRNTHSTHSLLRLVPLQTYTSIQVANSQKGNPLLSSPLMKTTPWSYNASILSDYYINPTLQILFLSLKYHKLRPEYIWQRLKKINKGYSMGPQKDRALRILLVVVDIDSHQEILRKLLDICIKHDLSLILAWSFEEAGAYVVFCKQNELLASKVESSIKGAKNEDYHSCVLDVFTGVRSVNKTDVANLLANCGLVRNIVSQSCRADSESGGLGNIQGLGSRKLDNLRSVLSEPFIYNKEY